MTEVVRLTAGQEGEVDKLREVRDVKEIHEIGSQANREQSNLWLPEDVLPGFKEQMSQLLRPLPRGSDRDPPRNSTKGLGGVWRRCSAVESATVGESPGEKGGWAEAFRNSSYLRRWFYCVAHKQVWRLDYRGQKHGRQPRTTVRPGAITRGCSSFPMACSVTSRPRAPLLRLRTLPLQMALLPTLMTGHVTRRTPSPTTVRRYPAESIQLDLLLASLVCQSQGFRFVCGFLRFALCAGLFAGFATGLRDQCFGSGGIV